MIILNSSHLLFIEPLSKKMEQDVNDEITVFANILQSKMKPKNGKITKGWHTCKCGKAHSDNMEYTVSVAGKTYTTNKLLLHYIKNHRSEVPQDQLNILKLGIEYIKAKESSINQDDNEEKKTKKIKIK